MRGPTAQEIEQGWDLLALHGEVLGDEFRYYELASATPEGPVLLAIDSSGYRHLLVPVSPRARVREDRRSRGVHIQRLVLEQGSDWFCFVDVVCRLPHLHALFTTVIGEMLEALQPAANVSSACGRVLDNWRELLERAPRTRLSRDAVIGLMGELMVLSDLLDTAPDAVNSWRGPEGDRHDFRAGHTAIEVKTTLARKGRQCEIHGHDQLEPPADGELYFCFTRLEPDDTGSSLPELVDHVQARVDDHTALYHKLASAGYAAEDADDYREERYRIVERRFYHVDQEFPAIVSNSFAAGAVPPGVVDLRYVIELASEPPHPLPEPRIQALLEQVAGAS